MDEVLTGLQKLCPLSLDRTPAAEVLPGTALSWHEAITAGRDWDKTRDTPRIRAAFTTLANTRETWPAPKHFLDALPRVEQRSLAYEVKPLPAAEADARLAALRAELDKPLPESGERPVPRRMQTTTDVAAAERELRQHYGSEEQVEAQPHGVTIDLARRDGRAAAAGPDA
jgi:hypothetical protein